MKKILISLLAFFALPTAVNADHKYPPKNFKNIDDFSLVLTIMEVGLGRCNVAKGNVSPEKPQKSYIKACVKELVHLNTIIMKYIEANNYVLRMNMHY